MSVSAKPEPSRPLVFAHRGTRLMAPENTRAAFEFAERYQADVLETDVRLSADGQVIVTHDETLERTTNGTGKVREHDLEQLRTLDAGFRFRQAGSFPWRGCGLTLLTLDELFDRFAHLGINIDIKDKDPAAAVAVAAVIARHRSKRHTGSTRGVESDAAALAGDHDIASRRSTPPRLINVGSFHQSVIEAFRAQASAVSTAAGKAEVARLYFSAGYFFSAGVLRKASTTPPLPFSYLQIPRFWYGIPLARPGFIQRAHSRGVKVVYWTIDSPPVMTQLLARGADGIVTDRADLAQPVFARMRNR